MQASSQSVESRRAGESAGSRKVSADIRLENGRTSCPVDARSTGPGSCVLRLRAGESVVVALRGAAPGTEPHEVPANGGGRRWGGAA